MFEIPPTMHGSGNDGKIQTTEIRECLSSLITRNIKIPILRCVNCDRDSRGMPNLDSCDFRWSLSVCT